MLCNAACFLPWALELNILCCVLHILYHEHYCLLLHAVYCHIFCAKGHCYLMYCILSTAACFLPWALLHLIIAYCVLPVAEGTAAFLLRVLLLYTLCCVLPQVLCQGYCCSLHYNFYDICCKHCPLIPWALFLYILYAIQTGTVALYIVCYRPPHICPYCYFIWRALLLYILYAIDRHIFVHIAASYMLYTMYWCIFRLLILVSYNVYYCVPRALPLCVLGTAASLLHVVCCSAFCILGIAALHIIYHVLPYIVPWAPLCFVNLFYTAAWSAPWVLLLQILHGMG